MPFIFLPVFIFVEELVQIAVVATAVTVGARATAEVTNRTVDAVYDLTHSSSSTTSTPTLEQRTIYDWWCNGLASEEREILLERGYSDRSGCFSLEELKSTSERMFAEKAPGKPTAKDGFIPDKKQGDKLVKNPNGKGKGWLDENGEVWVPTGKGGDDNRPEGRPHGGSHWDVQNPRTGGHRNVYPGGRVR